MTDLAEAVEIPKFHERVKALEKGEHARLPDGGGVQHVATDDGRDAWQAGSPTTYGRSGLDFHGPHHDNPEDATRDAMKHSARRTHPESVGGKEAIYPYGRHESDGREVRVQGFTVDGKVEVSDPGSPQKRVVSASSVRRKRDPLLAESLHVGEEVREDAQVPLFVGARVRRGNDDLSLGKATGEVIAEGVAVSGALVYDVRWDDGRVTRRERQYRLRCLTLEEEIEEAADSLAKASSPEPFSTSKTSNWVARGGGLPAYIQHVAHALVEKGKSESNAIQMAIGIVKNWAAGKGNVDATTRAAAAKAVSEWEALKSKNAAKKVSEAELIESLAESLTPTGALTPPKGQDTIRRGATGGSVKTVQQAVGAKTDGQYGAKTVSKVKSFQKTHGLKVDGVVGAQTALAVKGQYATARKTKPGALKPPKVSEAWGPEALAARKAKHPDWDWGGDHIVGKLKGMKPGETLKAPGGMGVERGASGEGFQVHRATTTRGFERKSSIGDSRQTFHQAAKTLRDASAGTTHPESLGGTTRYSSATQAEKHAESKGAHDTPEKITARLKEIKAREKELDAKAQSRVDRGHGRHSLNRNNREGTTGQNAERSRLAAERSELQKTRSRMQREAKKAPAAKPKAPAKDGIQAGIDAEKARKAALPEWAPHSGGFKAGDVVKDKGGGHFKVIKTDAEHVHVQGMNHQPGADVKPDPGADLIPGKHQLSHKVAKNLFTHKAKKPKVQEELEDFYLAEDWSEAARVASLIARRRKGGNTSFLAHYQSGTDGHDVLSGGKKLGHVHKQEDGWRPTDSAGQAVTHFGFPERDHSVKAVHRGAWVKDTIAGASPQAQRDAEERVRDRADVHTAPVHPEFIADELARGKKKAARKVRESESFLAESLHA